DDPAVSATPGSALRPQHRPGAVARAAAAGPDLLQARRVPLRQGDAVVVHQFLARANAADGLDQHPVAARVAVRILLDHRLAVGRAAVVDPARGVAADIGVDDVVVVEGEQERVAALAVVAVLAV